MWLIMLFKFVLLGCGVFGVCIELICLIEVMLECGVILLILEKGFVGVLGDLVLFVYMIVVMMGYGEVFYVGECMDGVFVLCKVGLEFVVFVVKEGFVLINGM